MDMNKPVSKKNYANKSTHKVHMKKRHLRKYTRGEYSSWSDFESNSYNRYYDGRYWKDYYLSGVRRFAKRETNRKIRRNYRLSVYMDYDYMSDDFCGKDYDNLTQPSKYRKVFDYMWTIW